MTKIFEKDILISAKNLTLKANNKTTILSDLTFDIQRGDFIFFLGKNGTGKSILSKSLYFEIFGDENSKLKIFGTDIKKEMSSKKILSIRRKMGIMICKDFFIMNKSIYENFSFFLKNLGWKKEIIKLKINEVLSVINMSWASGKNMQSLSLGEKQKIFFASSLLNDPAIFIADEPVANLDEKNSQEIFKILEVLNEKNVTIIVFSHNENLIKEKYRVFSLEKKSFIQ
jgi:cell division transport system ATP-binding protein